MGASSKLKTPRVLPPSALGLEKVQVLGMVQPPSGGDVWPKSSHPQQTGVPPSRSPHVCKLPQLMATNRSSRGIEP